MTTGHRGIRIRGARTHNLRDVDLDVPLHQLVVFTGPSGSGKSSLAFDTIHAESVRRFAGIAGGRDEPESVALPIVRSIEGLGVTIASSTRSVVRSSRSTVATLAGVADPIRRVFAMIARPVCKRCGGLGERHDVRAAADAILGMPEGTKVQVLATVADGVIDDGRATLDTLRKAGFVRARIDGTVVDLSDVPKLAPKKSHRVEAVVDRFVVRVAESDRAREAIELAYRTSGGAATVEADALPVLLFSRDPRCNRCGEPVDAIAQGAFSRGDPANACESCGGTGLVAAARSKGSKGSSRKSDDDELSIQEGTCASCEGLGVRPPALDSRALGVSFRDVFGRSVEEVVRHLAGGEDVRATSLVASIVRALSFLSEVGLGHLSLGRRGHTLSSGEASRARLAGPFANELVDVTYVLDEPTAGLHPSERPAILGAMRRLVDAGNSVLCVEHDAGVVAAADLVVELGPAAGEAGGRVLVVAPPAELPRDSFSSRLGMLDEIEASRRAPATRWFKVELANVAPFESTSIEFPIGRTTAIAGPSGSGKSTLLAAIARGVDATRTDLAFPRASVSFANDDSFERVVRFDDVASFPGPRSLVATRLGVFPTLRETFANLPDARARGFDAARFGLTSPGGRCDVCEGRGVVRASSTRGIDTDLECPRCGGSRYDVSVTAVRYRGASLIDVLDSSLVDARSRFEAIPAIERPLSHAIGLGLGHLTLGRAASAVSAGESTRLRLAAELARRSTERALLLLDEPCRGLSSRDSQRLADALDELAQRGATVLFVEHSVASLARADFMIDLDRRGAEPSRVTARGAPASIAHADSRTAPFLARVVRGTRLESY